LNFFMKAERPFIVSVAALMLSTVFVSHLRAEPPSLALQPAAGQVQLSWPGTITDTNQALIFPEYQVLYSTNLTSWQPIGGKLRGLAGRSGPSLNLSLNAPAGPGFYRLQANLTSPTPNETGEGGAEVFGYGAQFATELQQIAEISLQDFATNAANIAYLPQLTWDPRTAQFWSNLNSGGLSLSTNELSVFLTNGFVVSERLGAPSFADIYYRLFHGDLPVFITSDSILHAWHRSYQSMLEELEEIELSTLLSGMISNMSQQLPQTWQQYGSGPLRESIRDADYFLTVANSLWAGGMVPSALGDQEVNQLVGQTLAAVNGLTLQEIQIFGGSRVIDFSQFKVRGHYDASVRLGRYFQTMMWCGRTDLRVALAPNGEDDIRQLGTAVVLQWLLTQSGQFDNWSAIERVTRAFVGTTDSMTFAQLRDLLAAARISGPADVTGLDVLTNLQTQLLTGELGAQSIHSDFFYSPLGPQQVRLPRSFTVCGQKFVLDSWAFSQVVYDRILWSGEKVVRRKPTCLDVAFSTLGNDQMVPEIIARILNPNGVAFRDGLPYQHNLLAVRKVVDTQDQSSWTNNIYSAWLAALRTLSVPTTDPKFPEAMRTRPWAMKTLNTQMGSWTELRHDTLLYVKQSYAEPGLCSYPAGFVEPRPEFWQAMKVLAETAAAAISSLRLSDSITIPSRDPQWPIVSYYLPWIQSAQIGFLGNFRDRMETLRAMAEKELAQQPFTIAETQFLKDIMENTIGYTGIETWNGWYPQLFYANRLGGDYARQLPSCAHADRQVVDVHTDLPSPVHGDPGAVIHEAVGNMNLLIIAVDNGFDRMIYAGPVLSHYEFEMPGVRRLNDSEWETMLATSKPPLPAWTKSYLVSP
jgi:hypothetical protein